MIIADHHKPDHFLPTDTDYKPTCAVYPLPRSTASLARPLPASSAKATWLTRYCELVTDWEDVEQRENVTCVTCQEKLWACRCEDPDVDEQRR